mmetsp:Transcript_13883/g.37274  ORF Transcript_13883/g.37274 Transcript_13883/m.37274 type:complete len:235 (+) Transcript_13883:284-988(+)
MQGAWHHCTAHQDARYRWQQDQVPRPWCSVCSSRACPCWPQDRTDRGCDPHPHRLHSPQERTPRSPLVGCHTLVSYAWIAGGEPPLASSILCLVGGCLTRSVNAFGIFAHNLSLPSWRESVEAHCGAHIASSVRVRCGRVEWQLSGSHRLTLQEPRRRPVGKIEDEQYCGSTARAPRRCGCGEPGWADGRSPLRGAYLQLRTSEHCALRLVGVAVRDSAATLVSRDCYVLVCYS